MKLLLDWILLCWERSPTHKLDDVQDLFHLPQWCSHQHIYRFGLCDWLRGMYSVRVQQLCVIHTLLGFHWIWSLRLRFWWLSLLEFLKGLDLDPICTSDNTNLIDLISLYCTFAYISVYSNTMHWPTNQYFLQFVEVVPTFGQDIIEAITKGCSLWNIKNYPARGAYRIPFPYSTPWNKVFNWILL